MCSGGTGGDHADSHSKHAPPARSRSMQKEKENDYNHEKKLGGVLSLLGQQKRADHGTCSSPPHTLFSFQRKLLLS